MPLAVGHKLGPYEIVSPLGSGGMGDVYRARDSRLGRDVALKVLPPDVTQDPERLERFDREARAIAALNHPHIVTIYSTEESGGIRFLTMELVEGTTLTERIVPGGLPVARFLEIAMPLADALAAAHQKQITHRDLKPANVMISHDGRVKVLDFGLARIGGAEVREHSFAATQAPLTQQGMIVGTMPYMSPEQVEGRAPDPRSDLFSLGVMCYEMLTGDRPFTGASSPALMSAILRDTPQGIGDRRPDVPDALERLIARCIEKRPEDRVQTARDVFNELRHVQQELESGQMRSSSSRRSGAEVAQSLWIAVLPFSVRGADRESDELATGLTEDVTAGLSRFPGLAVLAPQSARAYKDSPLDVRQIAERLGARYIIGGSVRKSSSSVRVSAQLIDAQTGAHLWSETYDRSLAAADLYAIQDDVTDRTVATIADQSGVLARSMVRAVREQTSIAESTLSQLLLRTWGFQHNPTPPDHAVLRAALQSRLEEQPDNAHLWAELAHMCIDEHSLWFNALPDPLGRALTASRRAIELDPGNQRGWQNLALTCFYLHDQPGMEEASQRAIRLNPRNANTLAWMGNILTHAGEYDRGCALTERAMEINPGHPGWLHFAVFNRHFARGQYADALSAARRVNIPEFMWMHFAIAAAAGHLGLAGEARAAADAMTRIAPFLEDPNNLREFVVRWYWPEEFIALLLEGVSMARSLDAAASPTDRVVPRSTAKPASSSSGSGAAIARQSPGMQAPSGSLRAGLAVTVRPFACSESDHATRAIADGLTADVATGLARFSYVRLIAGPTAEHAGAPAARYVVEGDVRTSGRSLRINARLVDVTTGVHVWSDVYNRDATADAFALVDDVASRIAATIADGNGALLREFASTITDEGDAAALSILLRFNAYARHFTADVHAQLRDVVAALVEREPHNSSAWTYLALLCTHEVLFGFNLLPDALERARQATDRAIAIDSANQGAWTARAMVAFLDRDLMEFRTAVDRAIELNPLHTGTVATSGLLIASVGDTARGAELVGRAMSLNPHHPGWYHIALFLDAYRKGDADAALMHAKRITMPHIPTAALFAIAGAGRFGRAADARFGLSALQRSHAELLDPQRAREALARWMWDGELLDSVVEGFEKALALAASAG